MFISPDDYLVKLADDFCPQYKDYVNTFSELCMWIISTILEGGSLEEAIVKAMTMNAKRPSDFPPQGFVLAMLEGLSQTSPSLNGAIDVSVVNGGHT